MQRRQAGFEDKKGRGTIGVALSKSSRPKIRAIKREQVFAFPFPDINQYMWAVSKEFSISDRNDVIYSARENCCHES